MNGDVTQYSLELLSFFCGQQKYKSHIVLIILLIRRCKIYVLVDSNVQISQYKYMYVVQGSESLIFTRILRTFGFLRN